MKQAFVQTFQAIKDVSKTHKSRWDRVRDAISRFKNDPNRFENLSKRVSKFVQQSVKKVGQVRTQSNIEANFLHRLTTLCANRWWKMVSEVTSPFLALKLIPRMWSGFTMHCDAWTLRESSLDRRRMLMTLFGGNKATRKNIESGRRSDVGNRSSNNSSEGTRVRAHRKQKVEIPRHNSRCDENERKESTH